MDTITEIAKKFPKLIKEQHPHIRIFETKYLTIDEDDVVRISSYPYDLEKAKIVLVICSYTYVVITQEDSSNFFLFMDQSGWKEDYYVIDGWTISFNRPCTSMYRTYSRECTISKDNLKISFYLRPAWEMAERIQKLWPYITEIVKSKTQRELDYIHQAYEDNVEIEELKEKIQNLEYSQMVYREQIDAYKDILDKIRELVNHATPTT